MNYDDFMRGLERSHELEWGITDDNDNLMGIRNTLYETEFMVDLSKKPWEKFETFRDFLIMTHAGRNIEHATRVTGYFSKAGGWNPGKRG